MGKHRSFQKMQQADGPEGAKLAIEIRLLPRPGGYRIAIGFMEGVCKMLRKDAALGGSVRENIKEGLAKMLDAAAAGAFDNEGCDG